MENHAGAFRRRLRGGGRIRSERGVEAPIRAARRASLPPTSTTDVAQLVTLCARAQPDRSADADEVFPETLGTWPSHRKWGATTTDLERGVHQLFERQAARTPRAQRWSPKRALTLGELDR